MQKIIIIRYSEIHLKGNNRGFFEHALSMNLKTALKEFKCEVKKSGAGTLFQDTTRIRKKYCRSSKMRFRSPFIEHGIGNCDVSFR